MENKRILVIDEHPAVREGIEHFAQKYPDITVVASTAGVQSGLEAMRSIPADIILTEIVLSEMEGPDAIRLLLQEFPGKIVLVYSRRDDENAVYRSLKAGAKGYIHKSRPLKELFQAIRQIRMDDYILSPNLNPAIISFYLEHREHISDRVADFQLLTRREKQVFRLLAEGHDTNEISGMLCISPKTVAKHRVAVKKKLDLRNEAEMAQYAIREGLISLGTQPNAETRH